ncbi:unnamed protein product [Caenorhabditis angaria]|uniref:Actin-related protein 10 n=1 Tax=Caenorhabditis angaria TaxID=860376 RepID=A0A9P1N4S9_9PELO|nr:unnamed protein product [Caenorhabditis angaria]
MATAQEKLESLRAARRSSSGVSAASILSVSSSTLSQAISSIDNGKSAVIIELGTKFTKLGSAGETTPRAILRTEYINENGVKIDANEIFALNDRKKAAEKPVEYHENIISQFFKFLFLKALAPTDRPFIIVESVFMSIDMRNAITKTVLEKLRAKSIMFMPTHICSTFAFNSSKALVIDIGHSECVAMPVIEGVTMLSEFESAHLISGKIIEQRCRELLKEHGQIDEINGERRGLNDTDFEEIDSNNLIETIAINSICIGKERAQIWKSGKIPEKELLKEHVFAMNGKNLIIPPIVLETPLEIFFDASLNTQSFDKTLPQMLFSIVEKCPIDLRKSLLSNIILIGGVSTICGLKSRIKEELIEICQNAQKKYAEDVRFYQFSKLKNYPLFGAWLGASLLGSLRETVERKSISLQDWKSGKLAEDWTDIIDKNV